MQSPEEGELGLVSALRSEETQDSGWMVHIQGADSITIRQKAAWNGGKSREEATARGTVRI